MLFFSMGIATMGNFKTTAIATRPSIADDVLADMALENLREANRQLVALVADLAFDNAVQKDFVEKVYRESADRGKQLRTRAARPQ